jgi:hypothetical protein
MKVTGRCHCGQISFAAEIDPAQVRVCHCTDCQTLTGTAFRTAVPSLPGSFTLKSGTPKIYIRTAYGGNKRAEAFCPDCGTALYAYAADSGPNPPFYGLRVGPLDRRAELKPAAQFWCRSALPWSMDLTGVPQFEGQFATGPISG